MFDPCNSIHAFQLGHVFDETEEYRLQVSTQYEAFTLSFAGLNAIWDTAADYGYRLVNTANATQLNYPFFLAS